MTDAAAPAAPAALETVRIGLVSISDRASAGVYADQGLPALEAWLGRAVLNPVEWRQRLIAEDEVRFRPRCAR